MDPIVLTGLAFASSLVVSWIVYPKVIPIFKKLNVNQTVSEYALDEFKEKPITPTLGGVVFVIISVIIAVIFNGFTFTSTAYNLCLMAFIGYALLGFIDDYKIIKEGKNDGLKPIEKLILQFLIASIFYYFYQKSAVSTIQIFPSDILIDLGIFYAVFVLLMFIATTNAVNITDGMDGLSGGTSFIALGAFLFFAIRQQEWSVAILISSLMGALVGYLKNNMKPAKIIMGDCGSHALGGLMAALAMVLKIELLLIVIGGVFVWETASVALQIAAVKTIKRRIFKYTPIHYSFILSGYREQAIVLMFYAVGLICAIAAIILGVI